MVGGKVVTMHNIKEVIKGGKIQISRCGDRGCEILFRECEAENGSFRRSCSGLTASDHDERERVAPGTRSILRWELRIGGLC